MKSINTFSALIISAWLALTPSWTWAKQTEPTSAMPAELQQINFRLANNQLQSKDVDQLNKYLKLHPRDAHAHYLLGKIYEHGGLTVLSDEEYHVADHLAPDRPESMLEAFVSKLDANDISGALQDFGYLSEHFPNDPSVLLMWAMIAVGKGQPKQADKFIERALKATPTRFGVASAGGSVRLKQGKPDEALVLAKQDLAKDPDSYLANAVAGQAATRLRLYDEAARYLRKAFSLRPLEKNNDGAFAKSFIQAGMYGDALAPAMVCMSMCTQADELQYAKQQVQSILEHLSNKVSDNVAQTVDGLLSKSAYRSRLHLALGDVYDRMGWVDAAVAQYHKGLALDPEAARGYYRLGLDLLQQGNTALARAALRDAYRRDRQAIDIQLAYARTIQRLRNSHNDLAFQLKQNLTALSKHQ
jgi:Tfp pilus assembly protein PilF